MAKSRFLIDASHADARSFFSRPLFSGQFLSGACSVCGLIAIASLPAWAESSSHQSTPQTARAVEISTSGAALNELPPAPVRNEDKIENSRPNAPKKISVQKIPSQKTSPAKPAALQHSVVQTTALKTSSASRMVMRRAGTLRHMSAERDAHSQNSALRFALTSPDESLSASTPDAARAPRLAATSPQDIAPEMRVEVNPDESVSASATAASDDDAVPVTGTIPVAPPRSDASSTPAAQTATIQIPAPSQADVNLSSSEDANDAAADALSDGPVSATIAAPDAQKNAGDKNASGKNPKGKNLKGKNAAPVPNAPSRLFAPHISYDRGTIIATGDAQNPVRLESSEARIIANEVRLDTVGKTVTAQGKVRVERQITSQRYNAFGPRNIRGIKNLQKEATTETLTGDNFKYNFGTKQGSLDNTRVRVEAFNIDAENLEINGPRTVAHNVIIRPGGLTDEEIKIYGTPPFNLRVKTVIIDRSKPAPPSTQSNDTHQTDANNSAPGGPRIEARNAYLYYKNFRLLPVPSALLRRSGNPREESTYQITPRIYSNSSDGILVTTRLQFPLTKAPTDGSKQTNDLHLNADVGLSTKVGFRGGLDLVSDSRFGNLKIGARLNDVISSQLTDRIQLDRLPEIEYRPPNLGLFNLPGNRRAGLRFSFTAGDYRETFTDQNHTVKDSRLQGQVTLTSRLTRSDGPYIDLFARGAKYGSFDNNLTTMGLEVGYVGHLGRHFAGQISFTGQNVRGATPFRFDRVEIRRELRTTFDILLTPRFIIPIDLRYDLDRHTLRDERFGLLRNYKTFAYGLTYDTARHELGFEIRQGF